MFSGNSRKSLCLGAGERLTHPAPLLQGLLTLSSSQHLCSSWSCSTPTPASWEWDASRFPTLAGEALSHRCTHARGCYGNPSAGNRFSLGCSQHWVLCEQEHCRVLTCHIVACGASWGLEGPLTHCLGPALGERLLLHAQPLSPRGAPSQRQGEGSVEKALQPAVFIMILKTQPQIPTSGGLDES